jgi:hypothetical protein
MDPAGGARSRRAGCSRCTPVTTRDGFPCSAMHDAARDHAFSSRTNGRGGHTHGQLGLGLLVIIGMGV